MKMVFSKNIPGQKDQEIFEVPFVISKRVKITLACNRK